MLTARTDVSVDKKVEVRWKEGHLLTGENYGAEGWPEGAGRVVNYIDYGPPARGGRQWGWGFPSSEFSS